MAQSGQKTCRDIRSIMDLWHTMWKSCRQYLEACFTEFPLLHLACVAPKAVLRKHKAHNMAYQILQGTRFKAQPEHTLTAFRLHDYRYITTIGFLIGNTQQEHSWMSLGCANTNSQTPCIAPFARIAWYGSNSCVEIAVEISAQVPFLHVLALIKFSYDCFVIKQQLVREPSGIAVTLTERRGWLMTLPRRQVVSLSIARDTT